MNAPLPVPCSWDGEHFVPLRRFAKMCDQRFVIGELYSLGEVQPRSIASHNHEFAFLATSWRNLPERFDDEPWARSAEHLRKFGLISCGFCSTETFVCSSKAEAMRWASTLRSDDEYCIIKVEGTTIHRFRAESQSKRSMGARRFAESKTALLEFVAGLIGTEAKTLEAVGESA